MKLCLNNAESRVYSILFPTTAFPLMNTQFYPTNDSPAVAFVVASHSVLLIKTNFDDQDHHHDHHDHHDHHKHDFMSK